MEHSLTHSVAGADGHEANQPLADPSLVACPACDLVQKLPQVEHRQSARCARCNVEIRRGREDWLNRSLALTIAAAVLYFIVNLTPMLGLSVAGHKSFTNVVGGAEHLWQHGQEIVAVLIFFAVVLAPALQISILLIVVIAARAPRPGAWVGRILRYYPFTKTWSMIEVMLVGVLVSLTKIAELATVIPGEALFAIGVMVFVLTAMQSSFDAQDIWSRIEWAEREAEPARLPRSAEVAA